MSGIHKKGTHEGGPGIRSYALTFPGSMQTSPESA